jgi:outer membrane murein-binding lipoprotein Lpp
MDFMNSKLLITALFAGSLLLAGCNQTEKQIVEEEDKNNPSTEEQRAETKQAPKENKRITEEVGLGDTRDLFTEAYGENKNNEEIARYNGDSMLVEFQTHRAVNIELQFEDMEKEMSNEEVLTYIEERIPKDAEEVNRVKDDNNREIIEYKSELLKENLSEEVYEGDEPGTFTVLLTQSEENYVSATLSIGHSDQGA